MTHADGRPSGPDGRVFSVSNSGEVRRTSKATIVAVAAAVVVALCTVLLVGESRYRSCIARADARYPAVAVSAFTGRATGPLKVSFVAERARALDDCGRFF
jgi:hypothetical protein